MARGDQQLIVRLPTDLKAWLVQQAQRNGRSQNAEAVQIIKMEKERCEDRKKAA